jgi:hypothetical protein
MITLTNSEWLEIYRRLQQDYSPSVTLMRGVMRRELGFVVRKHDVWLGQDPGMGYATTVYLDFFDDAKETWFTLKYLNHDKN